MTNKLPDFLIIGAMKAGTTSLAHDLARHPDIFVPEDKEPDTLITCNDIESMKADYASLYRAADARALKCDASTSYAKRPTFEGIAETARKLLGPVTKLVYIRRDPIGRIVSHYKHSVQHKDITLPFSEALRAHPELIQYSRYAWQLAPWIAEFGEEALLQIDLEEFSRERDRVVSRVVAHIGADPERLPALDPGRISNSAGELKAIDNVLLDSVVMSKLYRRRIKPLVPKSWRMASKRVFFDAPKSVEVIVTDDDRQFIIERLAQGPAEFVDGTNF